MWNIYKYYKLIFQSLNRANRCHMKLLTVKIIFMLKRQVYELGNPLETALQRCYDSQFRFG